MKLPEVLDVLLKAEDESQEKRGSAEREAEALVRETRTAFEREKEARLSAARAGAKAQVDSAAEAAEAETQRIAAQAERARAKMKENFDKSAPALITRVAEELAADYAARGRA